VTSYGYEGSASFDPGTWVGRRPPARASSPARRTVAGLPRFAGGANDLFRAVKGGGGCRSRRLARSSPGWDGRIFRRERTRRRCLGRGTGIFGRRGWEQHHPRFGHCGAFAHSSGGGSAPSDVAAMAHRAKRALGDQPGEIRVWLRYSSQARCEELLQFGQR
jgi:hypothetical protein